MVLVVVPMLMPSLAVTAHQVKAMRAVGLLLFNFLVVEVVQGLLAVLELMT